MFCNQKRLLQLITARARLLRSKTAVFCRLRNLRALPASLPFTSRVHTCRRGAKLLLPCDLNASASTLGRRFRLLDLPHLRGRTRPAGVQAQLPIRASPNFAALPAALHAACARRSSINGHQHVQCVDCAPVWAGRRCLSALCAWSSAEERQAPLHSPLPDTLTLARILRLWTRQRPSKLTPCNTPGTRMIFCWTLLAWAQRALMVTSFKHSVHAGRVRVLRRELALSHDRPAARRLCGSGEYKGGFLNLVCYDCPKGRWGSGDHCHDCARGELVQGGVSRGGSLFRPPPALRRPLTTSRCELPLQASMPTRRRWDRASLAQLVRAGVHVPILRRAEAAPPFCSPCRRISGEHEEVVL